MRSGDAAAERTQRRQLLSEPTGGSDMQKNDAQTPSWSTAEQVGTSVANQGRGSSVFGSAFGADFDAELDLALAAGPSSAGRPR